MKQGYKTLGIIGGMGPEATSVFFNRIVKHTDAEKDQDHINSIILNYADMPDRTKAIISEDTAQIREALENCARVLEGMGAENIAIPCNTAHFFIDAIKGATDVNVISMVDESAELARDMGAKKVGIMATDGTVWSGVYARACKERNMIAVHPPAGVQRNVMSLIYDDIKQGKPGDPEKFNRVIESFREDGCDIVILACTELSVYCAVNEVPDFCIDAMDVLVKACIEKSGAKYV